MNKEEFLRQLEALLSGISEEERADAMAFYRSYFEDAGVENEASILEELGSPQKVADSIMKNLGIEGGYYNTFANRDTEYYKNVNDTINHLGNAPEKDNSGMKALGIVALIFTSPLWLSLLMVVVFVLIALVMAIFAVAIAVVAVMVSLVIVGFVLMGAGFATMFGGSPAVGIGLLGGGLIVLALGLLAVVLVVWVFGVFVPWAVKGIVKLCKKPFEKRKERMAA